MPVSYKNLLRPTCHGYTRVFVFVLALTLWLAPFVFGAESSVVENASYKNLNPRPYDNCEANDLIKLSACCNDVLADLDDCKAGDLACECCALQSMDRGCYNLCPGNPLTNFLAVLFDDCSALNDVNACNIPFKRVDGDRPASFRNRQGGVDSVQRASSLVKTQLATEKVPKAEVDNDSEGGAEDGELATRPRPHVNLIGNGTGTYTYIVDWVNANHRPHFIDIGLCLGFFSMFRHREKY